VPPPCGFPWPWEPFEASWACCFARFAWRRASAFARPLLSGWRATSTSWRQIAFSSPVRPLQAEKSGAPDVSFSCGVPVSVGVGVGGFGLPRPELGGVTLGGTVLGVTEGEGSGVGSSVGFALGGSAVGVAGATEGGVPLGEGRTPGTALATVPPTITAAIA